MELPKRKHPRLKQYNYASTGAYFVTICTENRKPMLSRISVGRGLAPAELHLTELGCVAEEQLRELETRYDSVVVDKYVIMPNHIHILLLFRGETAGPRPRPTLMDVICAYKSLTTRFCKRLESSAGKKVFQTSFYEHVIRSEAEHLEIWRYIDDNPAKWTEDEFYTP